ncbi:MAG: transketolase [Rhodospirillaceae bacterium TMED8]|nr:transketolase [Magnetovibrio sp.]OUT51279.1 MAG: transketolase [Rhodospirillaceae bacterium TMED8]
MRKACLNSIFELAQMDERVVFIGSDLGPGTLDEFRHEIPDRFFMEGISEQNVIGMAAGMAMEGYIPFVNTIATFLSRRCYEQVAMDLCLHNLPVRLVGNGGGLVYAPLGPTHLAIEDIAIMRALPNMSVVSPCDAEEMRRFIPSTLEHPGPIYIRLAKGGDEIITSPVNNFQIGRAVVMREPRKVVIISTGIMTQRALKAAEILKAEDVECGVIHMHTVKPLDFDALAYAAQKAKIIVTVEEHLMTGGLGSAVTDYLASAHWERFPMIKKMGIPDVFPGEYGSQDSLLQSFDLTSESIAAAVRSSMVEN